MQNAKTEHSSRKVAKRRNKQQTDRVRGRERKKMERNEIHHDCFCIDWAYTYTCRALSETARRPCDIDFNFHLDMMILHGNRTNLYGFTIDYSVIPLLQWRWWYWYVEYMGSTDVRYTMCSPYLFTFGMDLTSNETDRTSSWIVYRNGDELQNYYKLKPN